MSPRAKATRLDDELDQVAALARMVERQQRALAIQDKLLRGLAGDVRELLAKTPAKVPPPVAWLLTDHPEVLASTLADLTVWLRDVYLWYPRAVLPSCWLWHPACVEELVCLRQYHREAYHEATKSAAKAMEFHERFLPGVITRLAGPPYADCDLSRHAERGDRARTKAAPAPLHDETHQTATAWMDRTVTTPTQQNLTDAKTADTESRARQRSQ